MGTLTRRSIGELKPKKELDKINNERSEANAQALLAYLMKALMSFVG